MLFMAVTGIAAYRSTEHLLEANNWVRHTFQVIGDAEDVRANLLELESACRGYEISGDERFLESIEGLGPARRRALLKTLGGLPQVKRAGVDELAKVEGISRTLAERIYAHFH